VPFGQARVARDGNQITLVSCGALVSRCLEAAERLEAQNISCEVIDLRTIVPLDTGTIIASLAKTGRLLVVDEAFSMCGLGAEIAATIMEQAFDELDAPVGRLHTDPVAQPFSPAHENVVIVTVEKIMAAVQDVIAGRPPLPRRLRGSQASPRPGAAAPAGKADQPAGQAREPGGAKQSTADGVPLIMPNQDLTITEGTIVGWLKQVGQSVAAGEGVVDVETDKATFSVEAPLDGTLVEILAGEGTVVLLGQQIGTIRPG
jgi:2-oxoisovalerate dehydrogenase E1 component